MWWNGNSFLNYCRSNSFDGVLVTYNSNTTKNSYASIDRKGNVTCVREKEVISNISLNGIHYWKMGSYFVDSYLQMYAAGDVAENGEYYVGPTYNYMIKKGLKVGYYHLESKVHFSLGNIRDLEYFLNNEKI